MDNVTETTEKVVHLADRQSRPRMIETVLDEHGPALRRFLNARLALQPDREDLLQEVFVRLSKLGDADDRLTMRPEAVRSFLFTIATNLIRDSARRAKVRETDKHVSYDDEQSTTRVDTPEDQLEASQKLTLMMRALRRVKATHRRAFILSRRDNKSYRDIADDLGVSISTVEKYISAVLLEMRKELL